MLLLALLVPSVLALVSGESQQQIWNGEDATENKFVVYLEISGKGDREAKRCGGVVYGDKKAVLTSAQCVAPKGRKVSVDDVKVVAGVVDSTDAKGVMGEPMRIVTHPGYQGGVENDIAMIILKNALRGTVEAIQLANKDWSKDNDFTGKVTLMGWGGTQDEKQGVDLLQKVEYSYSDQAKCKEFFSDKGKILQDGMFCSGDPNEDAHAWKGDEGGPVVITINADTYLAGLISWGNDRPGQRDYDVNTDVVHFKDWIELSAAAKSTYVELKGRLNEGVVILHEDGKDPVTICNHKVAQKDLDVICKSLGHKNGILKSVKDYIGRRRKAFDDMPKFGATELDCTDGDNDFAKCKKKVYPDEALQPCFNGQQLAVQCAENEWEFDFTNIQTKPGNRGKAMCRLKAEQYGTAINVKAEVLGMLVNIKADKKVEVVEKQMKYKRRQSTLAARYRDLENNCLACVAMVRGAEPKFSTYIMENEDNCKIDQTEAKGLLDQWIKDFVPEGKTPPGP
jgi:secreted trypsin-like serine protease